MKIDLKDKTTRRYFIFLVLWSLFLFGAPLAYLMYSSDGTKTTQNSVNVKPESSLVMSKQQYDTWQYNKTKNTDYVAQIEFESDLINLPLVQAYNNLKNSKGEYYNFYSEKGNYVNENNAETDGCDGVACNGNDVYIKMNWETMGYDQWGSNFIDYRNTLEDQNIIIYGHHSSRVYFGDEKAEQLQFTKIDYLLDKEKYEENKIFYLILEDEIRKYEITNVLKLDLTNDNNLNIYRTSINKNLAGIEGEDFYNEYIKLLNDNSLYETGKTIEKKDKFVTISTCIQGMPNLREIVIAKEIERGVYNEQNS